MKNNIKDIRIGTSGWTYDWNPNGFDWYIRRSGLKSVELNMSFYRFPFKNMIKSWARKTPEGFIWAVKVHQSITHRLKFAGRSLEIWNSFKDRFSELLPKIRYFLFQLPPSFRPTGKLLENLEYFINEVNLGESFVLEWRNTEWFSDEWIRWAKSLGITLCTVDSPELPRNVLKSSKHVYVRFHGRTFWYSHNYSQEELYEVIKAIIEANPEYIAIYFNNDHHMLENALAAKSIITKLLGD